MSDYDEIRLLGIGGYGFHGVLASERSEGQPFHADVVLHLDTSEAARTDALGHTANYADVARAIVDVIEGEPVNLIETLAARIADAALEFGAARVDVTIHKPQAPLGVPFTDVQVHISRTAPTGAARTPAGPGIETLPAEPAPTVPEPQPVPAVALLADNEGIPGAAEEASDHDMQEEPGEPVPVVLGLGGNLGDVKQTLRDAIADLQGTPGIEVTDVSALARTAPVLHEDAISQPDYLNIVVLATTTLSPQGLLEAVHVIEDTHGRVRVERWGDRTLDIDIITYGDLVHSTADLTLPHPRASQRAFVLVPWAQADPDAVLPGVDGGAVAELAKVAPDREGVRWLALDWFEEGLDPTTPAPQPPAQVSPPEPEPEPEPSAEPAAQVEDPFAPEAQDAPEEEQAAPTGTGEMPPVSQWLTDEPIPEPEYADAAPAIAVEPVSPAPAEEPPAEDEAPAPAAPVDWLEEKESAPPLTSGPKWLKVNPEE